MFYAFKCALHPENTIERLCVGDTHNCTVSTRKLGPVTQLVDAGKLAAIEKNKQQLNEADIIAQQRLDACKADIDQAIAATQKEREKTDANRIDLEAQLTAAHKHCMECQEKVLAATKALEDADRAFAEIAKQTPRAMDACTAVDKPVVCARKRYHDISSEEGKRRKSRKLSKDALMVEEDLILEDSRRVCCSFCGKGVCDEDVHICSWFGVNGTNVLSVCNQTFTTRLEYALHVGGGCPVCCRLNAIYEETDDFDIEFHNA